MKLFKKFLTEGMEEEKPLVEAEIPNDEDLVDDDLVHDLSSEDINSESTADLADKVQAAAKAASDGEATLSDKAAKEVAVELKTAAKGFDAAAWAPLDVANELTDVLDDCLASAMAAKAAGTTDGVDVLVSGLPGSGKTAITKQWAKARGVNLFYLNAKNDDLGAILNGFPVDELVTDGDKSTHRVTRSYSNALDRLDKENTVLFLDEFNRANPKLRAVLLSLINEHVVDGDGEDGYRHFDHLLFTIACVNPAIPTDPGAMELNDAEMSRFVNTLDWDSTVQGAQSYLIDYYLPKLIKDLKHDENYNYFYVRYSKTLALAKALLEDPRFEFDTRDDLTALFDDQAKMLNQRSIVDGIMAHGYDKTKFLRWVDRMSKFLEKDRDMIHEILDSWTMPDIKAPTNPDEAEVPSAAAKPATSNNAGGDDADSLDGDFNAVFGDGGEEVDTDLFGSGNAVAGKVDAATARDRIRNVVFSL